MLKRILKLSLATIFLVGEVISMASVAQAARLIIAPSSGSFSNTLTISVYVQSPDKSVNAYSGVVMFPKTHLEVVSLSKAGSIVSIWTQEPSFSNTNGTISFEGATFQPGFQGAKGKIISISFRPKDASEANVVFSSSQILANDGLGTDVTEIPGTAKFILVKKEITPSTPPHVKPVPTNEPFSEEKIDTGGEKLSDTSTNQIPGIELPEKLDIFFWSILASIVLATFVFLKFRRKYRRHKNS